MMRNPLLLLLFMMTIASCTESEKNEESSDSSGGVTDSEQNLPKIFQLVSPEESGLDFFNNITETQDYNYFKFQYTYNGAGVAIGDIDNDGLDDIYLVGNQTSDKLYLNKGELKFEDITASSGVRNDGGFNFGVTMVDINTDGFQDIYVCRSGHAGLTRERANLLFINNGDRTFTESAKDYGLDDTGHSIQSAFFDYDRDGDLDMYLTNHPIDYGQNLGQRLDKMENPDEIEMDKLFRNEGNGKFTDITREAGLVNYGHGLGLVIWDINRDGWDDIIVANDYQSSDWVYVNNQDGTFTDRMTEMFAHIPYYSMGIDVGDVNNDGLMDLNIVEMLPESYKRKLQNLSDLSEKNYYVFNEVGFHHQYTRNGFFLNTGMDFFSDIAPMTAMEATDWSWATLIADYDNDGLQDVLVTNGYLRDMQDKDYILRAKVFKEQNQRMGKEDFNRICQSNKIRNYLFKNEGDLEFSSVAKEVGMAERCFSNGAAYSDLDNDGDLDLVINNVNLQLEPDPAFLYENLSSDGSNFVKIDFEGPDKNPDGIGVKVIIETDGETMLRELRRTRGFESAVPDYLHFGVGERKSLDKVIAIWPDNRYEERLDVKGGSYLTFSYADATGNYSAPSIESLFTATSLSGLDFAHKDKILNEFDFEKQLPFRLGMQGPASCQADVNGDGMEDIFFTGSHDNNDVLYIQTKNGFEPLEGPWEEYAAEEHVACAFSDVDSDGDLDLFIGAGGIERGRTSPQYLDKLFFNDGKGNFSYEESALPKMMSSTSCISFGDLDGDGDLDAFIGTRSVAGIYGQDPTSYVLRNDNGTFSSIGQEVEGLNTLGMVTNATWFDFEADGDMDLVVVCEWMKPQLFLNEGDRLKLDTENRIPDIKGFWRTVVNCDLDGDGIDELVLGNSGINNKYRADKDSPLRMYLGNLDNDGKSDIMLAYRQGSYYHPDRTFTYLKDQFPFLKQKYTFYEDASGQSLEQIFGAALSKAELKEVNEMRSLILKKNGDEYEIQALPKLAQLSFTNAVLPYDVDKDGDTDLILAGNELYTPIQTGSYDASIGTILINNGKGEFSVLESLKAGVKLDKWVKGLAIMDINGQETLIAWRNDEVPLSYSLQATVLTAD